MRVIITLSGISLCMLMASCIPTVLLICFLVAVSWAGTTYISQATGRDESRCIGGGTQHPCKTLLYVADFANNASLNIEIQDPILHVTDNITFHNATSVTLEGSSTVGTVLLKCNCNNCGLRFEHSLDITIRFINFTSCGAGVKPTAAVLVYACYNLTVEESYFTSSLGTGLSIIDTYGTVNICDSVFEGSACANCTDSTGLQILFGNNSSNRGTVAPGSNYTIENCHTRNNVDRRVYKYLYSSYGGGISLLFKGRTTENIVMLRNITVEGNIATWGGGMFLEFRENAMHNRVTLVHMTFRSNQAAKAGGGLDIGYLDSTSDPPITNAVYVEDSTFTDNHARYGGGSGIYASHTSCVQEDDHKDNTLVFRSCVWKGNVARFSSTVDISPFAHDTLGSLYFPHPKFVECTFSANHLQPYGKQSGESRSINAGSFAVFGFEVQFEGWVEFYNHTFTALHVTDGAVTFLPGTQALFMNNSGSQGGALAMFGSSSLHLLPQTKLMFINNSASIAGGAIYHSTQNHHDFISSRTCFIQNGSNTNSTYEQKPKLIFRGNHAGHANQSGQSMFATTFLPCYFEQFSARLGEHTMLDALQQIAMFDFGEQTQQVAMATSGIAFDFDNSIPLSVVPGKDVKIPLEMKDELNSMVPSVYHVVTNDTCRTDRQYMIDRLSIIASEKTTCGLSLTSVSFRESLFKVQISVQKCPPGFHVENETCICSAFSKKNAYYGIATCHDRQSHAYLRNGFWAGYDNDKDQSLLTAPCPSSFCMTQTDRDLAGIQLPNSSSSTQLKNIICRSHRTGWLCGKCDPNRTTYYHSPTYRCGPQPLCAWGALFYFLSEIFPIVVMFSVIALCDIRFTTGTASGLVFFAQIIDTVTLNMKWNTKPPNAIHILSIPYRVMYGLLNFDFFNIEQASFCLWRNATVLDVIAFRYVSVAFAFILLLTIVLFLKYCSCKCLPVNKNRVGKNVSVIHSMSAVLVMCYAQCTNISFQILAKATLRGAGREPQHNITLFGGIHYLNKEHLIYAVAACFCTSTIVAVPPVLLLVYPGYLPLLSFCKLNETRPALLISKMFTKLKPFLDSFQGCYKDRLRFFSALYFVSRVVILAVNAFTSNISQSIIIVEIIILLMLGIYTLFHPFHKAADNINTGLILLNMAVIGCLTMLAYSQNGYEDQIKLVVFALVVRLILLYLPIVCTCIYVVRKAVCWKFEKMWRKNEIHAPNTLTDDNSNSHHVIDHNYVNFQEVTVDSSEPAPDNDLSYSYADREELLAYI